MQCAALHPDRLKGSALADGVIRCRASEDIAISLPAGIGPEGGTGARADRSKVMYETVPTIERAAAEIIERHGPDALPIIRGRADNAAELGDEMAAEAWRAIADAAEHLVEHDASG